MIGIGILIVLVGLVFYALIRSAGMADRKLEEIQRMFFDTSLTVRDMDIRLTFSVSGL